jgi:hypothetical protein
MSQTIPFAKMSDVQGHTPGPWVVPHFARDDHPCQCTSVVSGSYNGAICTVAVDNGITLISEGGNDAPPQEEAKANARLIAAAPDLLAFVRSIAGFDKDFARGETKPLIDAARVLVAKANLTIPQIEGAV